MRRGTLLGLLAAGAAAGGVAGFTILRADGSLEPASRRVAPVVPVEVAPVERGQITFSRTYSGTVEAPDRFVVAPKLSGRVQALPVDIGDRIERGQVVARLDDEELQQLVVQAGAELRVASARGDEAQGRVELARKELQRLQTLRGRGVVSPSQLDAAKADAVTRRATADVAAAEVVRARAALDAARVRLGYTELSAEWTAGANRWVVGARYVDEGDMVEANAPILSILALNPLRVVLFVPEQDYRFLKPNLQASLETDAYPGQRFAAQVSRVAPVFEPGSRQARIELSVDNPNEHLKPGMFARVTIILQVVDDAVIIPRSALTRRGDQQGVFILRPDGKTVRFRPVTPGLAEGERMQLVDTQLTGRVVTLGQQLLDEGSAITIPPLPSAMDTRQSPSRDSDGT